MVIIGVIETIAIPTYNSYIVKTKERVCDDNITLLENDYNTYLEINKLEDTKVHFNQYYSDYNQEVCPEDGEIIYKDGNIHCTYHSHIENNDEVEPVPYL